MKATLEFDLPEEAEALDDALHGKERAWALQGALEDFGNELRSKAKHSDTEPESWEEVRELFAKCVDHVLE